MVRPLKSNGGWLFAILIALGALAFALMMYMSQGCGGTPVVEPVGMGGHCDAHIGLATPAGLLELRAVGGADRVNEGIGGHAEVCVALNRGEFLCWVIARECERDESTGFCSNIRGPILADDQQNLSTPSETSEEPVE